MSHPNPPSYQYELVDADATILDPDATIGHNDDRPTPSDNAPPNRHQFQPPPPPPHPTLPTGQIIDGKNTLQSFDRLVRNDVAVMPTNATTDKDKARATRAAALATTAHDTTHSMAATTATAATTHPPDPQLYTLPTGEIINAKNINQCYNAMALRNDNYNGINNNNNNNKNNFTPPTNLGTDNVIIRNSNNTSDTAVPLRVTTNNTDRDHGSGNDNHNNNMPTVHAFAVESQIVVDAEPLQPQPPLQQQRSPVFYIAITTLVIISLVAAASLGVYCGTGNCKSNSGGTAMSPTTSPIVTLLEFILNITLSDESIMVNGTNLESMALTWMLDNYDVLNSTTSMTLNSLTKSPLSFSVQQYYPLLTMWFQQTLTSSPWTNVSRWTVDSNVCNWHGISCQTMDLGDGIGIQNVVTEIDFFNDDFGGNNYVGTIPADLGLLTMLEHFELYFNGVTGTLPASIGQWTALTEFNVDRNVLTGTFPASIGQWTALTRFGVSGNALTGTLPVSIGQWLALTYFDVNSNRLTGTLPASIGQWTALKYFAADINALNGTIPASIGQWLALTYFDVYGNALTGTLPASIGQWTALTTFRVDVNALTGTLPASIGQWTALTEFSVYNNALTGTIPASINNWSQIRYAYFFFNQFAGTMPNGICPFIDARSGDELVADCLSETNCTCCTSCS
jgi:hypothetical protein